MKLIKRLATLLLFMFLVAACGQKGDLYLPDSNQDPQNQKKKQD